MWHITKREIYDNLNSLRFALTTVLLLSLMLTNAVRHLREHPKRMQKYNEAVTKSLERFSVSRRRQFIYARATGTRKTLQKAVISLFLCGGRRTPFTRHY